MPSFTRRVPTKFAAVPKGSHPSTSSTTPPLYIASSGIPSIDDILGGGVPLGSVWGVLTPDAYTSWDRIIERYWVSRGLVDGTKSIWVGEGGEDIIKGCMWVEGEYQVGSSFRSAEGTESDGKGKGRARSAGNGAGSESEGEDAGLKDFSALGENRTKIAWRYEGMKKFQTTIKGSDASSRNGESSTGSELNLLKTIPREVLQNLEKTGQQRYIHLTPNSADNDRAVASSSSQSTQAWNIMSYSLKRLKETLKAHDGTSVLRITIHHLGSIDWGSPNPAQIMRYIHCLKTMVREKAAAVLITFPHELAQRPPNESVLAYEGIAEGTDPGWVKKLAWALDACIELKGFGDDPTLPPLFHPLHGLLTPHSLPTTHHLCPPSFKHSSLLGLSTSSSTDGRGGGAGENNLGFRLTRKRFVVETVHLGIEGGSGERRTEPATDTSVLTSKAPHTHDHDHNSPHTQVQGLNPNKEGTAGACEGVETGTGIAKEGEKKVKKVRAKVRFGGEEEMGEVKIDESSKNVNGGDSRTTPQKPSRPVVRHDRMDLYEF